MIIASYNIHVGLNGLAGVSKNLAKQGNNLRRKIYYTFLLFQDSPNQAPNNLEKPPKLFA